MCATSNGLFVFGGCYLNNNNLPNPAAMLPNSVTNNQALLIQQQQQQMAQPVMVTEYYTPQTDQWTIVKPAINLHKEASYFKQGSFVYVLGGYNIQAKTGQKMVSRYDYVNDQWQTVGQLPAGLTGVGCCSIDVPSYVFDQEKEESVVEGASSLFSFTQSSLDSARFLRPRSSKCKNVDKNSDRSYLYFENDDEIDDEAQTSDEEEAKESNITSEKEEDEDEEEESEEEYLEQSLNYKKNEDKCSFQLDSKKNTTVKNRYSQISASSSSSSSSTNQLEEQTNLNESNSIVD